MVKIQRAGAGTTINNETVAGKKTSNKSSGGKRRTIKIKAFRRKDGTQVAAHEREISAAEEEKLITEGKLDARDGDDLKVSEVIDPDGDAQEEVATEEVITKEPKGDPAPLNELPEGLTGNFDDRYNLPESDEQAEAILDFIKRERDLLSQYKEKKIELFGTPLIQRATLMEDVDKTFDTLGIEYREEKLEGVDGSFFFADIKGESFEQRTKENLASEIFQSKIIGGLIEETIEKELGSTVYDKSYINGLDVLIDNYESSKKPFLNFKFVEDAADLRSSKEADLYTKEDNPELYNSRFGSNKIPIGLNGQNIPYLYRGVSYDEMQFILKNGFIQSNQAGNIGDEVTNNITVYGNKPSTAMAYAYGFAPDRWKPTKEKPNYVIEMSNKREELKGVSDVLDGYIKTKEKAIVDAVFRVFKVDENGIASDSDDNLVAELFDAGKEYRASITKEVKPKAEDLQLVDGTKINLDAFSSVYPLENISDSTYEKVYGDDVQLYRDVQEVQQAIDNPEVSRFLAVDAVREIIAFKKVSQQIKDDIRSERENGLNKSALLDRAETGLFISEANSQEMKTVTPDTSTERATSILAKQKRSKDRLLKLNRDIRDSIRLPLQLLSDRSSFNLYGSKTAVDNGRELYEKYKNGEIDLAEATSQFSESVNAKFIAESEFEEYWDARSTIESDTELEDKSKEVSSAIVIANNNISAINKILNDKVDPKEKEFDFDNDGSFFSKQSYTDNERKVLAEASAKFQDKKNEFIREYKSNNDIDADEDIRDYFQSEGIPYIENLREAIDFTGSLVEGSEILGVDFEYNETGVSITVTADHFTIARQIHEYGIYNESFFVNDGSPDGLGTRVLSTQVRNLENNGGYLSITTDAAQGNETNGYYTWARLGYEMSDEKRLDTFLDGTEYDFDENTGEEITRFDELMQTQGGRKWWLNNGVSFHGTFTLSAYADNIADDDEITGTDRLNKYLRSKGLPLI